MEYSGFRVMDSSHSGLYWRLALMAGRAGKMVAEMEKLNTCMHDKLLISDGRAVA